MLSAVDGPLGPQLVKPKIRPRSIHIYGPEKMVSRTLKAKTDETHHCLQEWKIGNSLKPKRRRLTILCIFMKQTDK